MSNLTKGEFSSRGVSGPDVSFKTGVSGLESTSGEPPSPTSTIKKALGSDHPEGSWSDVGRQGYCWFRRRVPSSDNQR